MHKVSNANHCNVIELDDRDGRGTDRRSDSAKIQGHIQTAFERIKLASDELSKVANNQGGNSDIEAAATYLFPPLRFNEVSEKLVNLYNAGRTGYISQKSNDNTPPNVPGRNDVVGDSWL